MVHGQAFRTPNKHLPTMLHGQAFCTLANTLPTMVHSQAFRTPNKHVTHYAPRSGFPYP